jgi:hypothetical protein
MRRLVNYTVFYGMWIAMIVGETYAWAVMGFALGTVAFSVGGVLLARFHYRRTSPDEQPFGWPLRLGKWITVCNLWLGLLVNTLLNGAPGVGIIESTLGYSWKGMRWRVIVSAVGYAGLWCLIHYLRPPGFIPIYWYPSGTALSQLWEVITW